MAHDTEAGARAALDALPGLTWRPMERVDLPAVASLYAECEAHDRNPDRRSLTGLEEYWDSPRSRPDEDTLVGWDGDGRAAALAWSGCNRAVTAVRNVHFGGVVRPDRRAVGVGRAVLRWQLAHAREWDARTREAGFGPLTMRAFVPADQADVRDLADRHGLAVERYFAEMSRPLDQPWPAASVTGVRIVDWDPERGPEIHRFVDEAFADHWGHNDRTEQIWAEYVGSAAFRPAWSVLAVDDRTGAVVGAALNCAYVQDWAATGVQEGYTDELCVAAHFRGRGVARALLSESMRRFAADGMAVAGLGVDTANETGALRLYESLGYRTTARTCVHQLVDSPE